MKHPTTLVMILIGSTLSAAAADYKIQKRFTLPGNEGWDYISVDSSARRLYVSHGVRVNVLDEDSGTAIGTIEDTPGVHGIAIAPAARHGFTSNGKEDRPVPKTKASDLRRELLRSGGRTIIRVSTNFCRHRWTIRSVNIYLIPKSIVSPFPSDTRRRFWRTMYLNRFLAVCALTFCIASSAQEKETEHKGPRPEDLPTSSLISEPGPSFVVPQGELADGTKIIVYGDQRFTDPANTKVTNPAIRRLLVEKIAEEHPNAVLMNGDVPYSGDDSNDYAIYKSETEIWRKKSLHVFPALGNHEFHGDPQEALEHWWNAFPPLRNRRWYSVQLGEAVYTIALDSDTSLKEGSDQLNWLNGQMTNLPKSIRFVFISLHHPPVADFQTRINVSHNPRPNEIALRDYLEGLAPKMRVRIIVCAGHIHNYERFQRGSVTYLVSGGGAASPVQVERTPEDLYQDTAFPNYHFVEFTLHGKTMIGEMHRFVDGPAASARWEVKDTFEIKSE
jgi:hypothetical protein